MYVNLLEFITFQWFVIFFMFESKSQKFVLYFLVKVIGFIEYGAVHIYSEDYL